MCSCKKGDFTCERVIKIFPCLTLPHTAMLQYHCYYPPYITQQYIIIPLILSLTWCLWTIPHLTLPHIAIHYNATVSTPDLVLVSHHPLISSDELQTMSNNLDHLVSESWLFHDADAHLQVMPQILHLKILKNAFLLSFKECLILFTHLLATTPFENSLIKLQTCSIFFERKQYINYRYLRDISFPLL